MGHKAIVGGVERHAVYRGYNGIGCDAPRCEAHIDVERASGPSARLEASLSGWTVRGDLDYCPNHSETAE